MSVTASSNYRCENYTSENSRHLFQRQQSGYEATSEVEKKCRQRKCECFMQLLRAIAANFKILEQITKTWKYVCSNHSTKFEILPSSKTTNAFLKYFHLCYTQLCQHWKGHVSMYCVGIFCVEAHTNCTFVRSIYLTLQLAVTDCHANSAQVVQPRSTYIYFPCVFFQRVFLGIPHSLAVLFQPVSISK